MNEDSSHLRKEKKRKRKKKKRVNVNGVQKTQSVRTVQPKLHLNRFFTSILFIFYFSYFRFIFILLIS